MKTGEQECGERLQVAELLVHHNTLNSNTLTHQLGEGKEGQEVWKTGMGMQTGLEGLEGVILGARTAWLPKSPGSPPPASNVMQMKV